MGGRTEHGRRASLLIAIAMLAAPLAAGTTLGTEDADGSTPPVARDASFEGPSWAAWRIELPEDASGTAHPKAFVDAEERSDSSATSLFCFRFNEALSFRAGFFWTRMAPYTTEVSADTAVGGDLDIDLEDGDGGGLGLGCGGPLSPGEVQYHVVMGGTDGEISGSFSLQASDEVQVTGFETGEAVYALAGSFDGVVSVVPRLAPDGAGQTYLHAKAVQNASLPMEIDGHLLGGFQGWSNSGLLEMGFEGPQGEFFGGTFGGPNQYLYVFTGPQDPVPRAQWYGGAPGSYSFQIPQHVDSWDANPTGEHTCRLVWESCLPIYTPLFAADVDLPTVR